MDGALFFFVPDQVEAQPDRSAEDVREGRAVPFETVMREVRAATARMKARQEEEAPSPPARSVGGPP